MSRGLGDVYKRQFAHFELRVFAVSGFGEVIELMVPVVFPVIFLFAQKASAL